MAEGARVFAISDQPQANDLLGYEPYVKAMAELLGSSELETPFTVGFYGAWGTGKSTFIYMLNSDLEGQGLNTIMIQPWQFDQKEDVWKALIMTVVQYLDGQKDDSEIASERL